MEEWEIFSKSHDMLTKLEQHHTHIIMEKPEQFDKKRLDELLFQFNIENIYATI